MDFQGTARFQPVRLLGTGGMGSVYEAVDGQRGAHVALKTLKLLSGASLYRFKQEFRSLADLRHPNLIQLFELFGEDGQWFFTMELVEGQDFLSHVRAPELGAAGDPPQREDPDTPVDPSVDLPGLGSADPGTETAPAAPRDAVGASPVVRPPGRSYHPERLRPAFAQLCQGVHALHVAGKIHRDIKPSNVLVTSQGRVVLVDFGLVKDLGNSSDQYTTDALKGTPAYMAPELVTGAPESPAVDWYAVGTLLYQALTGRLPYSGPLYQTMLAKQVEAPRPPTEIDPGVDATLSQLALDLLRAKPDQRLRGDEVLRRVGQQGAAVSLIPVEREPTSVSSTELFVGRAAELAALRSAWNRAQGGETVIAQVRGPSGIGKTALVERFLAEVMDVSDTAVGGRPAVVLRGRCYERESVPYKAFDGIVDGLSSVLLRLPPVDVGFCLPPEVLHLAQVFPVLHRIPALGRPRYQVQTIPDTKELRRRAFAAFRSLLSNLARLRPLVLFIDDLQWLDRDSLQLLLALTRHDDSPRMLLLGSARYDEAPDPDLDAQRAASAERREQRLRRFGGRERWTRRDTGSPEAREQAEELWRRLPVDDAYGTVRVVHLGPLSLDETALLTKKLLGHHCPREVVQAQQLLEAIARESSGMPFFVGELVRYLRSRADDAAPANPTALVHLDQALLARIDDLPSESRTLLTLVAVAEDPLPQRVLSDAAALPLSEDAWEEAVSALRRVSLIRRHGIRGSDFVEPFHDRIRETLVEAMTVPELQQAHRQLAVAMERWPEARVDRLARHWVGAGDASRALTYVVRAAQEALAKLAFDRSARYYRVALDLEPEVSARSRLWRSLGDVLSDAGRPGEAADAYLHALQGADTAALLEASNLAAKQLLRGGYVAEGLEVSREVLAQVGYKLARTRHGAIIRLAVRRARLWASGLKVELRDPVDISPRELMLLDALWSVVQGLSVVGSVEVAELQTRFVQLALKIGEVQRVCGALSLQALTLGAMGGKALERARELAERAHAMAIDTGDPHLRGYALGARGILWFVSGEWQEVVTALEQVEQLFQNECHGASWELANSRLFHGLALVQLGRLDELQARFDRHVEESLEVGDRYGAMLMVTRLNLVWLIRDDVERAAAELEGLLSVYPEGSYYPPHYFELYARCEQRLYAGDPLGAWETLQAGMHDVRRSLLLKVQVVALELAFLRGRIALACAAADGDLGDAERARFRKQVRRAARRLSGVGRPVARAWARMLEAGLANQEPPAAQGDVRRALMVALNACEETDSSLYHWSLILAAGQGRPGADPVPDEVEAWMRDQGVKNPARLARFIAPGW